MSANIQMYRIMQQAYMLQCEGDGAEPEYSIQPICQPQKMRHIYIYLTSAETRVNNEEYKSCTDAAVLKKIIYKCLRSD